MRPNLPVLIACFAATMAVSCGGSSSGHAPTETPAPTPSPIQLAAGSDIYIGVSAALTGAQAPLGLDLADAVDLAIEDFGGILAGRSVKSLRADDGCDDPEMAAAAAGRLAEEDSLVGVVGPMCTTGAQAANDVLERAGIVHITPSAARESLSAEGDAYFFRTTWRDERQAEIQAAFARDELDASTAVVIDDGEPYGKTLSEAFIAAYESLEGSVLAHERIQRGTTNFDSFARQLVTGEPDLIVFEGFNPEGALLLRDLREANFEGEFIGPDSLFNARDFIGTAGDAADGAFLTAGPVPDEGFTQRFTERFGRAPSTSFVLQAYDATRVLLEALDGQIGGLEGAASIDRSALGRGVRALTTTGLTGSISFDDRGDRAGMTPREAGLAIYRVSNGQFEQVE